MVGLEEELQLALTEALRTSYRCGEASFDSRRPEILWKGRASQNGEWTVLQVDDAGWTFGKLLNKKKWSWDEIEGGSADGDSMLLQVRGEEVVLEIEPQVLEVKLQSGAVATTLNAEDLLATAFGLDL